MRRNSESGFTLLEMVMAIAILGFLMIFVTQMMTTQVRTYGTVSRQTELEQKARVAMMHIIDEIKLEKSTYYSEEDKCIKYRETDSNNVVQSYSLVNLAPKPNQDLSKIVFYDDEENMENTLWYYDDSGKSSLITDQIDTIDLTTVTDHLIRIEVNAKDSSTNDEYQLLSWVRLY